MYIYHIHIFDKMEYCSSIEKNEILTLQQHEDGPRECHIK